MKTIFIRNIKEVKQLRCSAGLTPSSSQKAYQEAIRVLLLRFTVAEIPSMFWPSLNSSVFLVGPTVFLKPPYNFSNYNLTLASVFIVLQTVQYTFG